METVRSVQVSAVVETNKATYRETFELGEVEDLEDLMARASAWLTEHGGAL